VSKVEVLGKQFVEVFNMIGGESSEVYRLFSNRIKDRRRKIKPFELMLLNDRDMPIWVEAHPSIIEVDEEDYEVQLVFRDFTERKKAEEERKLYAEQLEQFILENSNSFDSEKIEQISIELESNVTRIEDHLSKLKLFDDSNLAELDGIESSLDQVYNIITSLTKEIARSQKIHSSSLQLVEKDVSNT
jgi:PAS domain S-box-containing protein